MQENCTKFKLVALLLTVFANGQLSAQAKVRGPRTPAIPKKTFRSPNEDFSFSYRSDLLVCLNGEVEACNFAMLPSCDEDAIVCVAYPAGAFRGTNFEGAGFEVRLASEKDGPHPCGPLPRDGNGSDGFQISTKHRYHRIGGALFTHGTAAEVAAGNTSSWDKYRVSHDGQCYELAEVVSESTFLNYDPGTIKEFSGAMAGSVGSTLDAMLHSFRFSH